MGSDRPAAGEELLVVLAAGEYDACDLACDVKEHPQMHVRVGVLVDMTAEGMKAKGKLRLLDVRKISGNKILVLRQPRLSRPVVFQDVDWPCDTKDILQLGRAEGPQEPVPAAASQQPISAVTPQEPIPAVAPQELSYGRTDNTVSRDNAELLGRLFVPLFFAILAVAVLGLGAGRVMPTCPAFLDWFC